MGKRITLVLGHPDAGSYCGALADTYAQAARQAGHEVKLIRLGELDFDPVLHQGYKTVQPLEPDLQAAQAAITWANHLVFVYPLWWGAMPALLKGFFDRVFLPGYAFKYRRNSPLWDRLLSGRSAQVFTTMDTPPWYYRLVYSMPAHHQMRKTILEFCGIRPVRITSFGPLRHASDARKAAWLEKVARAARAP